MALAATVVSPTGKKQATSITSFIWPTAAFTHDSVQGRSTPRPTPEATSGAAGPRVYAEEGGAHTRTPPAPLPQAITTAKNAPDS